MIKTRFLVLSDTHGRASLARRDFGHVDVVVHCGDLTDESKLAEFRAGLDLLRSIDAPLKLVIAGNHDFTLDTPVFRDKVADAARRLPLGPDEVAKAYGSFGEARTLFDGAGARDAGIRFLDQGTYLFSLANGAALTVYASPFTPSRSDWAFQYHPDEGHDFAVQDGTDLVMTHGPPRGVLDRNHENARAGCPALFDAVARARPALQCFGHIHEGWGAKLITWRGEKAPADKEPCNHFSSVIHERSFVVEDLRWLRRSPLDDDDDQATDAKEAKARLYARESACRTSHCGGDDHGRLQRGRQTLFVNAALEGDELWDTRLPWLVDIELSPSI